VSNRLEDFVNANRAAFDSEEPAPHLGSQMGKHAGGKQVSMHGKMKKLWPWASAAAVLLLLPARLFFKKKATDPPAVVPDDVVKPKSSGK
jgi:hypothetical protein